MEDLEQERRLALIDVDGTLAPTTVECKEGIDIRYNGTWGYAPLIVSLTNTQEVLFTKNRSGNQPSHSGAAEYLDATIAVVRTWGFKRVRLRGETDFSLTHHFDRWTDDDAEFVFGIDAHPAFVARAGLARGGLAPTAAGDFRVHGGAPPCGERQGADHRQAGLHQSGVAGGARGGDRLHAHAQPRHLPPDHRA